MYDSVVNAFQTQSDYIKEDREENQKRAEEIVLKSLNENHPKIKDFIQQATLDLQEKMHVLRETHIKELFGWEKKMQEMKYSMSTSEKDMMQRISDLETQLKERDKLIQ